MDPDTFRADTARGHAEALHRLHHGPQPLVLVNAWDAASARVLEQAGAPVVATTSAGMAWSLGYPDGEQVPRDEFIAACARICRVVRVPVSVDIERGFGGSTDEVCEFVRTLLGLGVAGLNIEDGTSPGTRRLLPPGPACERIAALRALAAQAGVRLFINARTDVYLAAHDDPAGRLPQALERARMFISAGADGIFVPGLDRPDEAARLAGAIDRPLNLYAGYPGVPPVAELAAAGVRRISLGCGPLQSALGLLGRMAAETFTQGRYDAMTGGMAGAGELNRLFPPRDTHGKQGR
jgi:2-methylisocitrate lyase-like PEP mutase family enzyme